MMGLKRKNRNGRNKKYRCWMEEKGLLKKRSKKRKREDRSPCIPAPAPRKKRRRRRRSEGEKKKISLRTSDDENVAMQFQTVKTFFQDESVARDAVMPVPNVHSAELVKIIDFCTKSLDLNRKAEHEETSKKELRKFNDDFVKDERTDSLMQLTLAAYYLNVDQMLGVLHQCVADRIKNKSVEYVRKLNHIIVANLL